jgi:N-acetylneuraminic acid mutarotase
MMHANKQQNHARRHVGLVLALVGLISAATLVTGPIRPASAQADARSWSYTGSLNTPRYFHTATLLPDGKILVAGGTSFSGIVDSAELYDPVTGKWNDTGRLNVPRTGHTATLLKDGKVLIVGGSLNSAELYDPKEGKWSATGSLNAARYGHTATLLENGKVLVAGGGEIIDWDETIPLNTAELYDPDTGTWSFTGNLHTAVESHTATLLQNGKVLVLRGRGGSAELYDPDTGTWSTIGSLSRNTGFGHTATLLPDGRILIVGGIVEGIVGGEYNDRLFNPAELYDPSTGTWSSTGPLNRARFSHTATLLPNGKVLVAGGIRFRVSGGITFQVNVAKSELYDPETGTWSVTGNLNTPRNHHTATLLPDGKALLVGGLDGSSIVGLLSAELGNFAAVPPTIIMASVAGKKLIVVGENFNPDAVILLNGEEQKTRNDDQNPQTTLIGKNAGKKIKPGDRVQVRNPDGTLSEQFTFTG